MKHFTLIILPLIFVSLLLSCGNSLSKSPVVEFHNYISKISAEKSIVNMHLTDSKLWQGENNTFFRPFDESINADDLIAHTMEKFEENKRSSLDGWGTVRYYLGIFKTEENAKNAEYYLINILQPNNTPWVDTQVNSEIYRNGKRIFFIMLCCEEDKNLVSPEIRKKGKELIGLK
jgi:hypothetical protein